jgi:hypothetical protein
MILIGLVIIIGVLMMLAVPRIRGTLSLGATFRPPTRSPWHGSTTTERQRR